MTHDPPQTPLQAAAGLIASGRAGEAAQHLTALVREAPTYAAAHVLLANAREASGDPAGAMEAWHDAYFLVPSSPLVRRELERLMVALADATDQSESATPEASEPREVSQPDAAPPPEPPHHVSATPPGDDLSAYTDILPAADDSFDVIETDPEVAPQAGGLDEHLAPGGTVDTLPTGGLDDDLDDLIRGLETAPRIRPDPNFNGPDALANEDDDDGLASETLAKIFEAQAQYTQAAEVYEKLARQSPERADELRQRAEELRDRAS